jgi:hypothetical protein
MAEYKCTNFGNCSKADQQEIITDSSVNPVCPECGTTLSSYFPAQRTLPMKNILIGIILSAAIAAVIYLVLQNLPTPQVIDTQTPIEPPISNPPLPAPSKQIPPESEHASDQDVSHTRFTNMKLEAALNRAYIAANNANNLKKGSAKWREQMTNARLEYEDILKNNEATCKDFELDSDNKASKELTKDQLTLFVKVYAGLAVILDVSGESDKTTIENLLLKGKDCLEPNVTDVNAKRGIYQNLFELKLKNKDKESADAILNALEDLVKNDDVIQDFGHHDNRKGFCGFLTDQLDENHIRKNSDIYNKINVKITDYKIPCHL